MENETFQKLREFVEYVLTLPNNLISIDFDTLANDSPFAIVMMTNKVDEYGKWYQEPTINLRVSNELVEFWNNETMNGGKYPIPVAHLGLFDALSAKFDDINEFNAFVFLKEMDKMRIDIVLT